jgi:nitrogen fixation/metabolism regulation signal transduction histidine kinase
MAIFHDHLQALVRPLLAVFFINGIDENEDDSRSALGTAHSAGTAPRRSNDRDRRTEDTGFGLDSGQMNHTFEPSFSTKQRGIGIALATSRSIGEDHGGCWWARCNSPNNMVFQFAP